MRHYAVKPIDKILPRRVMSSFSLDKDDMDGRFHIHVTTHPSFFRAPMLKSQIHSQWDPEFCKSSEYQMNHGSESPTSHVWNYLWLNEEEKKIVQYKIDCGSWKYYCDLDLLTFHDNR